MDNPRNREGRRSLAVKVGDNPRRGKRRFWQTYNIKPLPKEVRESRGKARHILDQF